MSDYLNVTWTGDPLAVPPSDRLNLPGNWTSARFDRRVSDAAGHHSGSSPLIGNGNARIINGKLLLRLEDFAPGVEIQIRQYEVRADGSRAEVHEPHEFYTSPIPPDTGPDGQPLYPARTHVHFHVWSYINAGHRLGIELSQWPHDLSAPAGKVAFAQLVATLD